MLSAIHMSLTCANVLRYWTSSVVSSPYMGITCLLIWWCLDMLLLLQEHAFYEGTFNLNLLLKIISYPISTWTVELDFIKITIIF